MDLRKLEGEHGFALGYCVQGSGPLLFLVGAPAGISEFAGIATKLDHSFTVVTHDPRGVGASQISGDYSTTPELLAGDLLSLIRSMTDEPVLIFGASGGAVTGLALLAAHPEAVLHLVLHEPPLFGLLPEGMELLARMDIAFRTAADDPDAGMQMFADLTETFQTTYEAAPRPKPIKLPPGTPAERARNRFFLNAMAPATVRYHPLTERLPGDHILIAAGEASIGQPARRAAEALAGAFDTSVIESPGNHLGMILEAERFGEWLMETLRTIRAG
ncbi:alpha/beta hydrolase [Mesorhizobium sp. YC-39]|uniref:alpha/beta fold hydrolase n=1 Tax=unclassified Mesorhizobium TaxID=325217 RepID=UPI0021E6F4DD|nr:MULTISPECIES: alpha/beta hydrolase [unclassified Mesorhizobium]MCV3206978.1 alpha/beta hydrolase [Mesorhizobium sp. YC-2]MCV3228704.1 alpha/beta hydrolase [Mesorhizobium sp. YC-39]